MANRKKGGYFHSSRSCGVKGVDPLPLSLPTNTRAAKLIKMSAATKENTESGAALARNAVPLPSSQSHKAKKPRIDYGMKKGEKKQDENDNWVQHHQDTLSDCYNFRIDHLLPATVPNLPTNPVQNKNIAPSVADLTAVSRAHEAEPVLLDIPSNEDDGTTTNIDLGGSPACVHTVAPPSLHALSFKPSDPICPQSTLHTPHKSEGHLR